MSGLLVKIVVLLFISSAASADTVADTLLYLRERALAVNITARIYDQEQTSIWNAKSTNVTISGRGVNVRLSGDNLRVSADITPYINPDKTILLVAQGEVWITSDPDSNVEYYSTMKSMPIDPGEKILFFPLGLALDSEQNIYTIELEIQVLTYDDLIQDKGFNEKIEKR